MIFSLWDVNQNLEGCARNLKYFITSKPKAKFCIWENLVTTLKKILKFEVNFKTFIEKL